METRGDIGGAHSGLIGMSGSQLNEQRILVQVSKPANMPMIMCEQSAQGNSAGPVMYRRMRKPGCAVSTAPRPQWTLGAQAGSLLRRPLTPNP